MKKLLSVVIALAAALGMSAFAAPVLDTAESAVENTNDVAVLAANYEKSLKPGLNMVGATTSAWNFEEADGMNSVSMFSGAGSVVDNPLSDGVNSSAKVWGDSYTSAAFPDVAFALPEEMDGDRPIYVSFKYYKSYTPAADEAGSIPENLWVMKNGGTYKAKDINGFLTGFGWRQFSGLLNFNNAYNAGNTSDINKDPIKSIIIKTKTNANTGKANHYFDDIMYVPSYKLTFVANDGSDIVYDKYVLLDNEGKILTSYTFGAEDKLDEKLGVKFIGWSTDKDATVAMDSIALNNEDVTLYGIWEIDETAAGKKPLVWDFETEESQTWSKSRFNTTYKTGMMVLDSSVKQASNNYINHSAVPGDYIKNTAYMKYLVIHARSLGDVNTVRFYFKTSGCSWSEANAFNIPIIPNQDKFTDYVVDMSKYAGWTGNYENCMFQVISPTSTGILEVEEIRFATEYEYDNSLKYVYNVNLKSSEISAWGNTFVNANSDNTIQFGRNDDGSNQGAAYVRVGGAGLDASVYNKLVIKAKGTDLASIKMYYSTTNAPGLAEAKTMTVSPVNGTDGFVYYVYDLGTRADFTGKVDQFMVVFSAPCEMTIHNLFFTNQFVIPGTALVGDEYHFNLTTTSEFKGWGHTFVNVNEDGTVQFGKDSSLGTQGAADAYIKNATLPANEFNVLVVKAKGENLSDLRTYYRTSAHGGHAEARTLTARPEKKSDGYTYYTFDFSTRSDYTGNVSTFMITFNGNCEMTVYDVMLTNNKEIKKVFVDGASEITEDLGEVVLTPYIRYTNGDEADYYDDVQYAIDSTDFATLVKNADGTATVKANKNGTVTVTATFADGKTFTKEIEISGQADIYTINYDANTTDAVTGMPESTEVRSFERNVALSDAVPVREGYTFVGWAPTDAYYIIDSYIFSGDTTAVTLKAIWADYDYALFPVEKNSIEGSVYVNGIWYNSSDVKFYGGSIIVDLTDGIGYIYITGETVEDTEYYMVTAAGASAMDFTPAKTLAYNEVRATGNTGIRFKATVAHQMRLATKENNGLETAEYGFIVSTENQISDADGLDLYLVDDGLAVKGVAYNKAAGIDKYVDETDEGVVMAAVLTGVAPSKKNYETTIYVRPYIVLESGLVVYGTATGDTYYNIAKTIAADMPEDAPYAEYINGIIATCAE